MKQAIKDFLKYVNKFSKIVEVVTINELDDSFNTITFQIKVKSCPCLEVCTLSITSYFRNVIKDGCLRYFDKEPSWNNTATIFWIIS